MKPYMAFSRCAGSEAGAFLVFACSIKKAKKTAWPEARGALIGYDDYIDLAVTLIKQNIEYFRTLADPEKLKQKIAHVIDNPPVCQRCEMWGQRLGPNQLCGNCQKEELVTDILSPESSSSFLTCFRIKSR